MNDSFRASYQLPAASHQLLFLQQILRLQLPVLSQPAAAGKIRQLEAGSSNLVAATQFFPLC
jgi:hypothetical protein